MCFLIQCPLQNQPPMGTLGENTKSLKEFFLIHKKGKKTFFRPVKKQQGIIQNNKFFQQVKSSHKKHSYFKWFIIFKVISNSTLLIINKYQKYLCYIKQIELPYLSTYCLKFSRWQVWWIQKRFFKSPTAKGKIEYLIKKAYQFFLSEEKHRKHVSNCT